MQISIVSDFPPLATEWDDLLERANHAPFFMRYAYQVTWWEHLGRGELILITARAANQQLVGVLPLFARPNAAGQRELALVGHFEVSDYLDMVIDARHEAEVQAAFIATLADLTWDELWLCSLPQKSPTSTHFVALAQAQGWQATVTPQTVCPVITLAADWESYLAGIDKKQRHEIRRKIRKLENETHSRWYVVDSPVGLEAAMDIFIELHQKSTPDKEDFWNAELIAFFKALAQVTAQAGWLKLFFIEVDGQAAGAMLCFDYNNELLLYNSGYNPELAALSVGNVLTSYTIAEAIRLGRVRYDFLRGDEVYKFRFGAMAEPIFDVKISRTQPS